MGAEGGKEEEGMNTRRGEKGEREREREREREKERKRKQRKRRTIYVSTSPI